MTFAQVRIWTACTWLSMCIAGGSPLIESPSSIGGPSSELDKSLEAALGGGDENGDIGVPVSAFFADPARYSLWKGDREQLRVLFDQCVAAGAPAAYALVSKDDEVKVCSEFFIAMPSDAAARGRVIELVNQFWRKVADAPQPDVTLERDEGVDMDDELADLLEKDVGQKYLYLNLDL